MPRVVGSALRPPFCMLDAAHHNTLQGMRNLSSAQGSCMAAGRRAFGSVKKPSRSVPAKSAICAAVLHVHTAPCEEHASWVGQRVVLWMRYEVMNWNLRRCWWPSPFDAFTQIVLREGASSRAGAPPAGRRLPYSSACAAQHVRINFGSGSCLCTTQDRKLW